MDVSGLKSCHSARANSICYSDRASECIQCPQQGSCAQETRRRLGAAQGGFRTTAPVGSQPTYPAQTQLQYPAPANHVGGVLLYDPMPTQDESVVTRVVKNAVSAASYSALEEVQFMIRRWRW